MYKVLYTIQLTVKEYTFNYFTNCYTVEYDNNKYVHEKLLYDYLHPNWRLQTLYNETDIELSYVQLIKIQDNDEYINYYFNREIRKHKYKLNDYYQNIIPNRLNTKQQYVIPLQVDITSKQYPVHLPAYFYAVRISESLTLVNNKLELCVPTFNTGYYHYMNGIITHDIS